MPDSEFTAGDVIALLRQLADAEIEIIVDGGWAVDAVLGRQTRPHRDLDIAIRHSDVPRLRTLLEAQGYRDSPRPDTTAFNFVLEDPDGRAVDVHTYEFDSAGNHIDGLPYPIDSLNGRGIIDGHPVRCITPEWLVRFHTEYEPDKTDFRDVRALCEAFHIPLPKMYEKFLELPPSLPRSAERLTAAIDRSLATPAPQETEALLIRVADSNDLDAVMTVQRAAFGSNVEAELTRDLLNDPTADPTVSLLAVEDDEPVGHILFSKARVGERETPATLLAPLAVVPARQRRGIGGALIATGLAAVTRSGADLAFVLGHPDYYTRHGFAPAGRLGYEAPYPIAEKDADAWMVQSLGNAPRRLPTGRVTVADAINRPEYWRE
ncbi:GNAT family N-acetyltransferase [Bauldia sp.]|uniref:GNAT family N-acetyltransferase n=1 Tax=Bauldia sp. TaxID=2575872 RepID=UPI003BAAAD25